MTMPMRPDTSKTMVVDRLEGDFAVLIADDGSADQIVPVSQLPPGVKEGDVLRGGQVERMTRTMKSKPMGPYEMKKQASWMPQGAWRNIEKPADQLPARPTGAEGARRMAEGEARLQRMTRTMSKPMGPYEMKKQASWMPQGAWRNIEQPADQLPARPTGAPTAGAPSWLQVAPRRSFMDDWNMDDWNEEVQRRVASGDPYADEVRNQRLYEIGKYLRRDR